MPDVSLPQKSLLRAAHLDRNLAPWGIGWECNGKAAFRRPRKSLILLAPREGFEPPT